MKDKNGTILEVGDTIRYIKKERRVDMDDRVITFKGCDVTCIVTGRRHSPVTNTVMWVTTDHPKYSSIDPCKVEKVPMGVRKNINTFEF